MDPDAGKPQGWQDLSAPDREAVLAAYAKREGVSRIAAIRELRSRHPMSVWDAKRIVEEGLASDDWTAFHARHALRWPGLPRVWLQ